MTTAFAPILATKAIVVALSLAVVGIYLYLHRIIPGLGEGLADAPPTSNPPSMPGMT